MPAASRAASHVVSLKPNKASQCFMSPYLQPLMLRVPSLLLMLAAFFLLYVFAISLIFFCLFFRLCPVLLFSARTGYYVTLPHCSELPYYIFFMVRCLSASRKVHCQRFSQNKEELAATEVIRYYLFTICYLKQKEMYTINHSWKGFFTIPAMSSK